MEIWKTIEEFPKYSVSNHGQVRRDARGPHTRPGKILKPSSDKDGYRRAHIFDGKVRSRRIARLVAAAFIGPIPEGMVVNHKDGNKTNDHVSNLEVVTISENTRHGFRVLGRKPNINPNPGEKNGNAKLTEAQILEIHRIHALDRPSQSALAKRFGVNQTTISRILRLKLWTKSL